MDNFWEKVDIYLYISQVGVKLLGHVGAQPRGWCFLFLMANHLVPENAFKLFVFLWRRILTFNRKSIFMFVDILIFKMKHG